MERKYNGLTFCLTCCMCPEQYDVYDDKGNKVGYVRLRWGELTCEWPDVFGKLIYSEEVGDGFTGCFESEKQRSVCLECIANEILKYMED